MNLARLAEINLALLAFVVGIALGIALGAAFAYHYAYTEATTWANNLLIRCQEQPMIMTDNYSFNLSKYYGGATDD